MSFKTIVGSFVASLLVTLGLPISALAASNVVVTPLNTQGWDTADTRPGGAVNFINDATAPAGVGALQLTTTASVTAKAQYLHAANTPLSAVTSLSYYTKQVSAPFAGADASYQLVTYLNGGTSGFATLVYEPYQNPTQGAVTNNTWQKWDVSSGKFWSTQTVTCSGDTITKSPGGPATYTLAQIKAACPSAKVIGYGVNIGSNNPSYNVETDLFNFNGTTYNFEPTVGPPTAESQCANGKWATFNNPSFTSQRQCEKYVEASAHGSLTLANPHQKIKFHITNQNGSNTNGEGGTVGDVDYTNYDYPGAVLQYSTNVLCTNINPATGEARFMFQIPEGHPGLSGLYVVSYLKNVGQGNTKDLYGHSATASLATATAWCQTGVGFTPTMYTVTGGSANVR